MSASHNKRPLTEGSFVICGMVPLLRYDAFFLQSTDCLGRHCHRDFLPVNNECLFLKVRLEYPLCATQRKTDVIAVLLSFSGDFTSRCHVTS